MYVQYMYIGAVYHVLCSILQGRIQGGGGGGGGSLGSKDPPLASSNK